MWVDIGEKKAWEKTSQLLREMVSKGDHPTVYQKRKWDKELKRLEIRNAKKLKAEASSLPITHASVHANQATIDPSGVIYSPLGAAATRDLNAARTLQHLPSQTTSPSLATRVLLEAPNIGQFATRRLASTDVSLLNPTHDLVAASQLQGYPQVRDYQPSYITTQPVSYTTLSNQTALETQLNPLTRSRIDPMSGGRSSLGDFQNASTEELMQLWLERNSAITELEQSILLRQQIEQANQQKATLLQRHNSNLLTSSFNLAPASVQLQKGYLTNNLNQQPSQQVNINSDSPQAVIPSTTWTG